MPRDEIDLDALTEVFSRLGAREPEQWARSQLEEGIPQLARFLFLREAWRHVVAEDDASWIAGAIAQARERPDEPFAGVGAALARLRLAGAGDADITDLVRGMQALTLFGLCSLLDGALEPEDHEEISEVEWTLVQVTPDGEVLGPIAALHESVLETDPTGREMRPRPAV